MDLRTSSNEVPINQAVPVSKGPVGVKEGEQGLPEPLRSTHHAEQQLDPQQQLKRSQHKPEPRQPYCFLTNLTVGHYFDMIEVVLYSAVQYSTVQYSTVQYSTVQYSTVQCSTVQYSTVQYSTVQYSTVQYSTVQYSTVQYSTVQYSTVQQK